MSESIDITLPQESSKAPRANQLKKILGVAFGIAVLVGGTIGSGILATPGSIAELLNNYWLIIGVWIFGGIYVLMGVGSFAELSTMYPKAGGSYNYVKEAFGNYSGFLTGWYDFICNGISPAYFCILIGEYLVLLFPSLRGYEKPLAIAFLMAFTLLHLGGVKNGSITQQITSAIKVIFFAALIIACFVSGNAETVHQPTTVSNLFTGTVMLAIFSSVQLVIGTYSGWNSTCFFAEEDTNPTKNIPKSLYTGALIVIGIYVLVNMAFLNVLPIATAAKSPLVASDAATAVFGSEGGMIVIVIALFSLVSILNAYMMIPARILFGMSRDGFFVSRGAKVNSKGTPAFALLFSTVLNLVLILVGSFDTLFSLAAFMQVAVYVLVYAALMKLRMKKPEVPRPHRAWGHPITTILLILISIALFVGFAFSDVPNLIVVLVVTGVSYPAYKFLAKRA